MDGAYIIRMQVKNQDTIKFDSGIELFQDTWLNNEEKVSLTGTVLHIPPSEKYGIRKGDQIYFRYDVVSDGGINHEGQRVHDNRILLDGELVWIVRVDRVIAVIRDGKPISVPDYIVGTPVKRKRFESSIIIGGDEEIEVPYMMDVSWPGTEIQPGTRVVVLPEYVSRYNFESRHGQEKMVLRFDYVVGIEQPT